MVSEGSVGQGVSRWARCSLVYGCFCARARTGAGTPSSWGLAALASRSRRPLGPARLPAPRSLPPSFPALSRSPSFYFPPFPPASLALLPG